MTKIELPYIKRYKDRLNIQRFYFNKRGHPSTALPGLPGSAEFMDAYKKALAAGKLSTPPQNPAGKPIEGTVADLIARYYASAAFKGLAEITQSTYRNEIEKIRKEHGDKPVAMLDRKGVKKLINEKADRPGAANKLLRTIRMLMGFAIDEEMRTDDPTARIKMLKVRGDGFIAWSEADIEKFEKRHKIGSKARLALALLLYTAQRRSDVVKMGPGRVKGSMISVRQQKTGTLLDIPMHPSLIEALRLVPATSETYLLTEYNKPFVAAGFGNWFRDRCAEAGLPKGYNAHGLRKAAARRLAEAGCTPSEIMAITGHKTLSEVERYTRSANQPRLAEAGLAKLLRSN